MNLDNIRFIYTDDLPGKVKAFTVKDVEDFYTVFLNAHHSHERLMDAVEHEMKHIEDDDFRVCESIQDIEYKKHGWYI